MSDVFYIILWAIEGIALVASTSIDTVFTAIPTHTPIFTLIYICNWSTAGNCQIITNIFLLYIWNNVVSPLKLLELISPQQEFIMQACVSLLLLADGISPLSSVKSIYSSLTLHSHVTLKHLIPSFLLPSPQLSSPGYPPHSLHMPKQFQLPHFHFISYTVQYLWYQTWQHYKYCKQRANKKCKHTK